MGLASEMVDDQLVRSLRTRTASRDDLRANCVLASVSHQLFGTQAEVQVAGKRFRVRRRLGAGAMGVVYQVDPVDYTGSLALKLLHHAGSEEAFRLKREFRMLSALAHPNLVVLHELFADASGAAFTMEHIQGSDFLSYVCAGQVLHGERLRAVVLQLLEGLAWLHGAGVIHRDLKPSNVLVSQHGRAVLLDFGVALVGPERDVSGTLRFMAPEQANGKSVAASDVYALGVMLELALVRAVRNDPGLERMARLSRAMQRADPRDRPSVDDVLRELGGRASRSVAPRNLRFIGRTAELSRLRALATAPRATPKLALVEAPAGYGKSALLGELVRTLRQAASAPIVLQGRCCRREAVQNRALDPLFDALSDELLHESDELLASLSVHVTRHLLELVPVLARVPAFARNKGLGAPLADARERRATALSSLRRMLSVLVQKRGLVLCIDDVHWLDHESAELMRGLLHGAEAPAALWLCAGRVASPGAPLAEHLDAADLTRIRLGPLDSAEALALALQLLPGHGGLSSRAAAMSAGHPLLLTQLSGLALECQSVGDGLQLEGVVARRIARLPAHAREVLEVVTVWAEPVEVELLGLASERSRADLDSALHLLEAQQYVRPTLTGGLSIEPCHEQIAELVQRALPADALQQVHRNIARALERAGGPARARALWFHHREAGDTARALFFAEAAAEAATQQLSFHEAAALFAECAALSTDAAQRASLALRRAEALVNAGRDHEAAGILQALAQAATTDERRFRLTCTAADLFFRAGYAAEAMSLLAPTLRQLGLRAHTSRLRIAASFVYHRVRTWSSGYSRGQALPAALGSAAPHSAASRRVELCLLVSRGAARGQILLALDYASRLAFHVQRGADREQLVRALTLEAELQATFVPASGRAEALLARAGELCPPQQDPVLHARVLVSAAQCALFRVDRSAMHESAFQAIRLLESHGRGVHVELSSARWMWHLARFARGADIAAEMECLALDAVQRSDRRTEMSARICLAMASLANGDTQRARCETDTADGLTGRRVGEAVHWTSAAARARIDLYQGASTQAYDQLRGAVSRMRGAGYLLAPWMRTELQYLLAVAALQSHRRGAHDCARAIAHKLAAESLPWARLLARQLWAALRAKAGATARAITELTDLAHEFETTGAVWYAWGSLLLAHQLEGGSAAAPVLARAHARGTPEPERFLAAYAPLRGST